MTDKTQKKIFLFINDIKIGQILNVKTFNYPREIFDNILLQFISEEDKDKAIAQLISTFKNRKIIDNLFKNKFTNVKMKIKQGETDFIKCFVDVCLHKIKKKTPKTVTFMFNPNTIKELEINE